MVEVRLPQRRPAIATATATAAVTMITMKSAEIGTETEQTGTRSGAKTAVIADTTEIVSGSGRGSTSDPATSIPATAIASMIGRGAQIGMIGSESGSGSGTAIEKEAHGLSGGTNLVATTTATDGGPPATRAQRRTKLSGSESWTR